MSIYDSSRARAHKLEKQSKSIGLGNSGTTAASAARDARRNAYLMETGGMTPGSVPKVTTPKTAAPKTTAPTTTTPKTTTPKTSGYQPVYGSSGLYTAPSSTGGSTAPKTGNTGTSGGGTKKSSGGNTTRGSGGSGVPRATVRSGMSDYDIQLRDSYNRAHDAALASIDQKKANYFQFQEDSDRAKHNEQVQQTIDTIKELTMQNIPIAQRATSENAHGSRHHSQFLQTQIDDARTKLKQLGGLKTDDDTKPVEAQPRERKWYDTVLDMANNAAGMTMTGVSGLLDDLANTIPTVEGWLMGEEDPDATFTGQLLRPITSLTGKFHDYTTKETTESEQRWRDDLADSSGVMQGIGELSAVAMALAPYWATALLTQGGTAVGATTTSASGAPVLSGVGNVAIGRQLLDKIADWAKDPKTISSYLKVKGEAYYDALANGAMEAEAREVAAAKAWTDVVLDKWAGIGGLLSGAPDLVQDAISDGGKSVIQDLAGKAIEKAGYDHDKKWFGWADDAVVDPVRSAGEFTGSAISSAVSNAISSGASDVRQALTDAQAGGKIRSHGKMTRLLQDALDMPAESEAHKLAAEMSERLEAALLETGMDVSELYHMSKKDQMAMIDRVMERTLTDREIGALSRILTALQ